MRRALAVTLLCAALALAFARGPAIAEEPGSKPPPEVEQSTPSQPQPENSGQEFYIVPARAIERVEEIIKVQQREIERLRAITEKGSCI